jgi:hypothetical protein
VARSAEPTDGDLVQLLHDEPTTNEGAPPRVKEPRARSPIEFAIAQGHELGWEQLVTEFARRPPDPRFADVDDARLEDRLVRDASSIAAAMCRWLELLGELVRRGVWVDQGARTPGVWLSWRLGIDGSTAREYVRVALRLADLPQVRERFAAGTLSYSKVRAITRVAVAVSEELLLAWADDATAAQLERIVRGLRTTQRAQRQEQLDGGDRRFGVRLRSLADGTAELVVRGPVDDVCAIEDGLRLLAGTLAADRAGAEGPVDGAPAGAIDPPGTADPAAVRSSADDPAGRASDLAPETQSPRVTAADQVEALGHVVAAAVAAGVPADTSGLDRTTLVLQVEGRELATEVADGPDLVPVRDAHGRIRAMDRRVLRRLACTAGVITAVLDGDGSPLDLGRRQRYTNAALRRAVQLRDRHCTFPGCHATRHLHVHHVQEWGQDGPTDLVNLVLLCSHHHRFVHDHGWTIEVRADGRHRFASTASAEAVPRIGVLPPAVTRPAATTASAEALGPRGTPGLRGLDLDTAITVLLHTYTTGVTALAA